MPGALRAHTLAVTLIFFIYFFIEAYLLYRMLLFSVKPQCESARGTHISLIFTT